MGPGKECLRYAAVAALLLLACRPQAVAATAVYAVTKAGSLFRSTDGARSWQQVPIPGVPEGIYIGAAVAVDPQNPNNIYLSLVQQETVRGKGIENATSPVRTLFRSTDGGQSWSEVNLPSSANPTSLVVDPTSPSTIYAVTGAVLYRSTDSGATFTSVMPNVGVTAIGFDPSQPGVHYAAGVAQNRTVGAYKSTDRGTTWTSLGNPSGSNFSLIAHGIAVDPRNSNVLYVPVSGMCGVVSRTGPTPNCGLLRTSDGGKTWETLAVPGNLYNVVFDSKNGAIYAAGTTNTVLPGAQSLTSVVVKSTDGGKTWTSLAAGLSNYTYPIKVYLDPGAANTLYAAPAASNVAPSPGAVFVSINGGTNWTSSPVAPQTAPNDAVAALELSSGVPAPPLPPAVPPLKIVSAASLRGGTLAPDSLAAAIGGGFSNDTATADGDPPTILAGSSVNILDSAGMRWQAPLLAVSPAHIKYLVPAGVALGAATVTVVPPIGAPQSATVQIASVAPGIFTLNDDGLAMGSVLRVSGDQQTSEDVFQLDDSGAKVARPIDLGPDTDQVYLMVSGTGFRAAGTDQTSATINGVDATVSFAGPQGTGPGLDQANILIPRSLAGSGSVDVVLTAAGQAANTVKIAIQ